MKVHSSTVIVPLAVVLLVVGAGAVLATTGGPSAPTDNGAPAAATASPGATTAPAPSDAPKGPSALPFRGFGQQDAPDDSALKAALDKLVTAGTITAAQEQAVLDAVKAERQARLDALKAQRDALKAQRDQIRQFLADGQITQDELNQLPADSPLRQLTSLMADGKITVDELRQLGRDLFPAIGGGRGHGFGFFGPHKGDQPDASASPAPSTGG